MESLLNNATESLLEPSSELNYVKESLLVNPYEMSFDGSEDNADGPEIQNPAEPTGTEEDRRKFFTNPENQANILLQNYLMSHPEKIFTGKMRRNLRREFLKNAKKGRYKKLFEAQISKSRENFENLNS